MKVPQTPTLGFAILSHKQPSKHFEMLLEYLVAIPKVKLAIHHDYNQSYLPQGFLDRFGVRKVENYRQTQWCGVNNVYALLDTFMLLYESQPQPDWYITLSTDTYPIKSIKSILDFLINAKADVYMQRHPIGLQYGGRFANKHRALFTKYLCHVPCITRTGKFQMKPVRMPILKSMTPFINNFQPYMSSDWFMFNAKAMNCLVKANLYNSEFFEYLQQAVNRPDLTICPPEIAFATFFSNQKELTHAEHNYFFIKWTDYVGKKRWHPDILTERHFDAIKNSDDLFARKFSDNESLKLTQKINSELINDF